MFPLVKRTTCIHRSSPSHFVQSPNAFLCQSARHGIQGKVPSFKCLHRYSSDNLKRSDSTAPHLLFRSCSAVEILISCSVVQSRHLIYDSFIKPKSTKTLVFSCFDGNKKPSHFRCNGLNNQILQFKINYCFLAIP